MDIAENSFDNVDSLLKDGTEFNPIMGGRMSLSDTSRATITCKILAGPDPDLQQVKTTICENEIIINWPNLKKKKKQNKN